MKNATDTQKNIRNATAYLCNYAQENFCKVTKDELFDYVMQVLNEEDSGRNKFDMPEDCWVFMDVARYEEFEGKYSVDNTVREFIDKFYAIWF